MCGDNMKCEFCGAESEYYNEMLNCHYCGNCSEKARQLWLEGINRLLEAKKNG
jgi:hypothetical protein